MTVIDNSLLNDVSAQAKASPRLRMNYNFLRPSEQANKFEYISRWRISATEC